MRLLVIIVLCATALRADAAPRIDLGVPSESARIERTKLELTTFSDHTRATLEVTFASDKTFFAEVATPIDLPKGTRVIGMVVDVSNSPRGTATTVASRGARTDYNKSAHLGRAPALVEYVPVERHPDRYVVSAFPISSGHNVVVAMTLELPVAVTIGVATTRTIPTFELVIDGVAAPAAKLTSSVEVSVPASTKTADRATTYVDRSRTLLSGEAVQPARPQRVLKTATGGRTEVVLPTMREIVDANVHSEISTLELRKASNATTMPLRACFPSEPAMAGHVVIHFFVLPSGKVTTITADGAPDDAVPCIVDVVARWRFSERPEVAEAMYPLELRAVH